MGNLCGTPKQKDENKDLVGMIDDRLDNTQAQETRIKLLLLGAGESGKSTLFKQMKLQYAIEDHRTLLIDEKEKIITMFIHSYFDLLTAICDQNGSVGSPELDDMKEKMFPNNEKTTKNQLTPDVVDFITEVWNSPSAKSIWENRDNFQITDSLGYFCEAVGRLAAEDYVPTEEDYLRCRVISAGIVEQTFKYGPMARVKFLIVDVGGQRAERKKWIQCFDNVNAVLFVIAISEFNQKLFEDNAVDRMTEAREVFKNTLNFKVFRETDFILFLNKKDLLEEKLRRLKARDESLDLYFPNLELDKDYGKAFNKIVEAYRTEFKEMAPGRIYTHLTDATDRSAFHQVFSAAAQVILTRAVNIHFLNSEGE